MKTSELKNRTVAIIGLMDELENMMSTVKELRAQIADEYVNAQSNGFTKSALKQAIKVHRLDGEKRDKFDSDQGDFEMYLAEIDGKANVVRMAAE